MTADLGPAATPRPVPSPEDRMRDATAPTEEHAAARAFNDAHPIGTPVRYWKGAREGDGKVSRTRTPAQLLSGHTAVVWLENVSGCIALTHIQPISEEEFAATPAEQWPAAATGRSFAAYLTATERDQLDARAAAAEQERDDAQDDRDTARAEAANLRRELDKANAGRQKLQSELDTMTQVAQGNKRHVAYLTAVIEAIANVEPHIHNGDATEDNCSPYCPGCRIRTAMNATPPPSVPPRRAQEASTPGQDVALIERAAAVIVAAQKQPHTAPYHWAGALFDAGLLAGSPADRAQEEPACTCYPSGFSPGTYEGPMRDCPVHGELSAEARP